MGSIKIFLPRKNRKGKSHHMLNKNSIKTILNVKHTCIDKVTMLADTSTRDHARINVRVENSNSSSRNGIILRCENNNTIYRMAEKSYEDIAFNSHIDIKVNLAKFVVEFLKQNIIKIILIVVFLGICIFLPNANGAFWGFLTGLISDMIIEWVKGIKWKKKKLFEN